MRRMTTFGLDAHAVFGPLTPLIMPIAGSVIGALAGKALAPKTPKSPADSGGPQPPQPPSAAPPSQAQPFFGAGKSSSALIGSSEGSFGGTFLSGSAAKPNLKKTLLGQ